MEKWLRNYQYSKKKSEKERFYSDIMIDHKEKLISDRINELKDINKRIKLLKQELEGMGIRDFDER